MEKKESYVIFDGACGFCNASALWIAKHDVDHHFLLISNVSAFGLQLLKEHGLEQVSPHSIILIDAYDAVFVKSRAIRKIMEVIRGYSFFKILMKVIPLFLQNMVYDGIARFRKRIPIGRSCELPDEKLRRRFKL